jgi:hypothetical protein
MHCAEFFRNMWNVWRTVLEENEKLARARLAAVEVFHQQIADDAKVLKAHKVQTARKVEHFPLLVQSHLLCVCVCVCARVRACVWWRGGGSPDISV